MLTFMGCSANSFVQIQVGVLTTQRIWQTVGENKDRFGKIFGKSCCGIHTQTDFKFANFVFVE